MEVEPEQLPSEYRILKWKDGHYSLQKVYMRDGVPFSYEEESNWLFESSLEALNTHMAEVAIGIHQAAMNPILSETDDFPGQYRYDQEMKDWLERQQKFNPSEEMPFETD